MCEQQDESNAARDLARAAVRGVMKVAVSNGIMSLVLFFGGIYLMEKVSPADFGIVKYAVALLVIFESLGNWGFAHGAIHRQERVEETFSAYLVLRLALTAGALCVLGVGALVFWDAIADKMAVEALAVLGGATLVNAVSDVWATRLQRAMRFGRLALVETVSAVVATALGVVLAAMGLGLWALIANRAIYYLLRSFGFWLASVERTRFRLAREDAVWLLQFGLPLWLGGLATTWVLQYDDLVVGSFLGSTALGHYDRAYKLALRPLALVTGVLTFVSMPLYARLQGHRARLSEAFGLVAGATFRLVAPLAAGLALVVPDFIVVMQWWQWAPIVPLFRWLLIYTLVRPLMDDAGGLLTAVGHPKVAGHTLIGQAVALLVLCPLLTGWFGAEGAAMSVGIVVVGGLGLWYVRYLPRFVSVDYHRILLWPLLSVSVASAAAWSAVAWARLDVGLASGVVKLVVLTAVYVAALLALDGRGTLADARTLRRHTFGKQDGHG